MSKLLVEFKLQDLKKLIYWITLKFKEDRFHHQNSSTKSDLIGGFLDKEHYNNFNFPGPINLTKSFKDYIEKNVDEKYYYNNKLLYDKIKDEVTSEDTVYQWRRKYVRANKSGVCPTLTANMGTGGHNVPIIKDNNGIRKLTPKECFLLQGFPVDFKLPDMADCHLYKQAGNSVAVPLLERISKNIKLAIEGVPVSYAKEQNILAFS